MKPEVTPTKPTQLNSSIIIREPGEAQASDLIGLAIGFDEDGRVTMIHHGLETLTDAQRARIVTEGRAYLDIIEATPSGRVH